MKKESKWLIGFGIYTVTALVLFFLPIKGCVESNFTLAKESRLPKWYTLPPNYSRDEITIEIFNYLKETNIITFGPPPERRKLKVQIGKTHIHPITEAAADAERKRTRFTSEYNTPFPSYQIITVDGIEEVFEHRDTKGPIAYLYVTDDPKITSVLGSKAK